MPEDSQLDISQIPSPPRLPGTKIDMDFSTKVEDKPETDEDVDPRQGLPDSVQVIAPAEGETLPPMELVTVQKVDPKGQYIQYNGIGTVRVMGPAEWKAAGIDSTQYCEWNYLNKKRLPRNIFSDQQLQYLLRIDDRFSLVTVEDTE